MFRMPPAAPYDFAVRLAGICATVLLMARDLWLLRATVLLYRPQFLVLKTTVLLYRPSFVVLTGDYTAVSP
jgi:hypothetical protein